MSLHDIGEPTKRALDVASFMLAGVAITLSQVALIVSIGAGLLSAAWVIQRFVDRYRYGPRGE